MEETEKEGEIEKSAEGLREVKDEVEQAVRQRARERYGHGQRGGKRRGRRKEEGHRKCFCGNGVCHLVVVAAGCRCSSGRQMDHEYCLDTLQPDALNLLSSHPLLIHIISFPCQSCCLIKA